MFQDTEPSKFFMTCAYTVFMGHRNEIAGYKLRKAEDARLDRWTSVGYVKNMLGRKGTTGAFAILHRCKKRGFMPTDDFVWFSMRKREYRT